MSYHNAEKLFDKIQNPFKIKSLSKLRIEGTFLNLTTKIYKKPTCTNIQKTRKIRKKYTKNNIFNDEKPDAFSQRSEMMPGNSL